MIKNNVNSTKKIPPLYWLFTVVTMIVFIIGGILFNQHQKQQTELQLAQLALEQSKLQNQSSLKQAASEPAESGFTGIESMAENPETQSPNSQAEDETVAGAIAAVDQAKAADTNIGHLSSDVDAEYHEVKTLSSNASRYGLKPIKSAPADLKATIPTIDQMLALHLMDVWGRSGPDQVAKRVEGWSQQGNTITYRAAWDSDRYQCTWYVVSWDKNSNQVLKEGYQPCFGH
ncbi:hypothetical protein OHV66_09970 [Acinetobacter baumannii]|uniref:hypothetical protein n=1 Tax=Acinetobacter pittii TaxID=48296 RepID=UPI0021CD758C|nr:hypothetical protein [Acinetobacter pittii]MCU4430460.1 hypothetical protein [Acinetobacter pittii]MCU4532225.1 hypothetical protein [Acinetobacter pittii]MDC4615795.1 hypothetical protein [Acinetobacter baumannii]MDN8306477.1 hypothetical protein [Acinetobacter baumannii]